MVPCFTWRFCALTRRREEKANKDAERMIHILITISLHFSAEAPNLGLQVHSIYLPKPRNHSGRTLQAGTKEISITD